MKPGRSKPYSPQPATIDGVPHIQTPSRAKYGPGGLFYSVDKTQGSGGKTVRRCAMGRVILLLLLITTLFGCTPQSPVPPMPKFETDQGKMCARSCQSTYAQCNQACSQMIGGATTARQRKQCLSNCNQILSDCYSTCE